MFFGLPNWMFGAQNSSVVRVKSRPLTYRAPQCSREHLHNEGFNTYGRYIVYQSSTSTCNHALTHLGLNLYPSIYIYLFIYYEYHMTVTTVMNSETATRIVS